MNIVSKKVLDGVTIVAQNVRSFNCADRSFKKAKSKICNLLSSNPDILFLSEIKLSKKQTKLNLERLAKLAKNGPYTCYFNSNTNARGVGIIVKNQFCDKVEQVYADPDENGLILKCQKKDLEIFLIGLYLPNQQDQVRKLVDLIPSNANIILAGDLNTVLDLNADVKNNVDLVNRPQIPNIQTSKLINALIEKHSLVDTFRVKNPNVFQASHYSKNGGARLDHILISKNLSNRCDNMFYKKFHKDFDHLGATLEIKNNRIKKKPTVLRDLHKDRTFNRISKVCHIQAVLDEYRVTCDQSADITEFFQTNAQIVHLERYLLRESDAMIKFMLDNRYILLNALYVLSYDFLTTRCPEEVSHGNILANMCITIYNESIVISGEIRKSKIEKTNFLHAKIKEFSNDQDIQTQYIRELEVHELDKLHSLNYIGLKDDVFSELDDLGLISRALGSSSDASLTALGNIKQREYKIFKHYKTLFSKPAHDEPIDINEFLNDINPALIKKVTADENVALTREVNTHELAELAKKIKPKKSTGLDNISNGMLLAIIQATPCPIINAFNECIVDGKPFHNFFRNSRVKLIPKKGDPADIKNWRPISIASSIFKLYSKLLYNRLEIVADNLLGNSQKGFRKSKSIHDVPLNIKHKIDDILQNNKEYLLLNLDFKSAFDSVGHLYITNILDLFGFNEQFIGIIKNYLENGGAFIDIEEGHFTQQIKIDIGVGQGLPLSVILFILAIEPLIIKINSTTQLSKLCCSDTWREQDRVEGFADDLSIFINNNPNDIKELANIINRFGIISSLTLNYSKTIISPINCDFSQLSKETINNFNFKVEREKIKILGNLVSPDNSKKVALQNWNTITSSLNYYANKIFSLHLPLVQKINAIKCFMLSRINYIAATHVCPPEISNKIETIIVNLINRSGATYSKKIIFEQKYGLKMPRVENFCSSQFLANFSKACDRSEFWTASVNRNFLYKNNKLRLIKNYSTLCSDTLLLISQYNDKINTAKGKDIMIFSNKFLQLSNKQMFRGGPPTTRAHGCNLECPPWASLSLSFCRNKSKVEIEDIMGYPVTETGYFNFINNCTVVSSKIKESSNSAKYLPKKPFKAKKIRLFLDSFHKKKTNTFKFLTYCQSKTDIRVTLAPEILLKTIAIRGIDINLKDFMIKLLQNKILSPAQKSHLNEDEIGNCVNCGNRATVFHLLFRCGPNLEIFKKIEYFCFLSNRINERAFFEGILNENTFINKIYYLIFLIYAQCALTYSGINYLSILKYRVSLCFAKLLKKNSSFESNFAKLAENDRLTECLLHTLDRFV